MTVSGSNPMGLTPRQPFSLACKHFIWNTSFGTHIIAHKEKYPDRHIDMDIIKVCIYAYILKLTVNFKCSGNKSFS